MNNNLSFNRKCQFTIIDKIYESEDKGRVFYSAFDEVLKRKVGIKKVKVDCKSLSIAENEVYVINEITNISSHIPQVYDFYYDRKEECFYIIMQLIQNGTTLRKYIEGKKIGQRTVLNIMKKLCDILTPIHRHPKKFQHRDLKPENIMITGAMSHEEVYLLDFNLTCAKPFKGEGTPIYQSPEQNERITGVGIGNTDIFLLGIIMYEMLTGEPPIYNKDYFADSFNNLVWKKFIEPKEKYPEISSELNDIIKKCMERDPRKRYKDAGMLRYALKEIGNGR